MIPEVRVTPLTPKAGHKDVLLILEKTLGSGKSLILPVFFSFLLREVNAA